MISISKKLIILTLCMFLFTNIYAVVRPTDDFYVNDYAALLSSVTEEYIVNVNTNLQSQTGAQVVVVTVNNLDGISLEEYATNLFRQFGIGDRTKNNGVLLLLALEERQFRVEVGYGLEGALNDAKTGRIQDEYIIPHLKVNNWDEGIKNGFDAIVQVICEEYNIEEISEQPVKVEDTQTIPEYFTMFIIAPFVLGRILIAIGRKNKWKTFITFLVVLFVTGGFGFVSYLLIPNKSIGIMVLVISLLMGLTSFTNISVRTGRGYSGRSGGGGFSGGGGGRSGGGGSSRSF